MGLTAQKLSENLNSVCEICFNKRFINEFKQAEQDIQNEKKPKTYTINFKKAKEHANDLFYSTSKSLIITEMKDETPKKINTLNELKNVVNDFFNSYINSKFLEYVTIYINQLETYSIDDKNSKITFKMKSAKQIKKQENKGII